MSRNAAEPENESHSIWSLTVGALKGLLVFLAAGPIGLSAIHPAAYGRAVAELCEGGLSPFGVDTMIPATVITSYGIAAWVGARWMPSLAVVLLTSLIAFAYWVVNFKGVLHAIATSSELAAPWNYQGAFSTVDGVVGALAVAAAGLGWSCRRPGTRSR